MGWLLYSRRGCHLCEVAEDLVVVHHPQTEVVDVDRDPATRARYGLRVPVLEIDGDVAIEGRFDESVVARLATRPAAD